MSYCPRLARFALVVSLILVVTPSLRAQQVPTIPDGWMEKLTWRSVGPANMSGRITALAVYENDSNIWWAASASGGLLKTVNNGVTFEHQFDDQPTVSIGDVQVFQGDPNIVWVGTGEANPRNSASWGNGIYRSEDGGKTWNHLGLEKTHHTGRIALHPTDPNVAYVGALGRLWGPNEDRGLYKTIDGGKTWEKIFYVDDKTGVIDIQLNPANPETFLFATYERQRDGFDGNDPAKKNGPGSGLYLATEGGKSITKLTEGLPSVNLGRIGLSWYRQDPNYVYAVIETEKTGSEPENAAYLGVRGEDVEVGARLSAVVEEGPAAQAGLKEGDIVIEIAGKPVVSYNDLLAKIRKFQAEEKAMFQVVRGEDVLDIEVTFGKSPQEDEDTSRRRSRSPFDGGLGGQVENLQDQQGPQGADFGGVFQSSDGGKSWKRINSLNPRPMYYSQIRVDPSDLNYIYVLGTQLYRSTNGGHKFSDDGHDNEVHVDHHALWVDPQDGRHMILGNDGGIYVTHDRMSTWDHHNHVAIAQFYHLGLGPRRNYRIYGGLQDNGSWGGPSRVSDNPGPVNSDWFRVGGGDGFICLVDPEDPDQIYFESQNGAMGRIHLKTGERGFIRPRPPRGVDYRFNWKTPFILSPHNSKIHYSAGNYVFRSLYKGDSVEPISPEITRTEDGSGSALSEAATEVGVLYVGTTDGWVWASQDGGVTWTNVFENPDELLITRDRLPKPQEGDQAEGGRGGQGRAGAGRPGNRAGRGGPAGRERFLQMLKDQDANQDGKIQRNEVSGRMAQMFDRLDANKDDVIDEDELKQVGQRGRPSAESQEPPADEAETQAEDETEAPEQPAESAEETKQESAAQETAESEPATESEESSAPATEPAIAPGDDRISGQWSGELSTPGGPANAFTLILRLSPDGSITGSYESSQADATISSGRFSPEENTVSFTGQTAQATIAFQGKVEGETLTGSIDVNNGAFVVEFTAKRTGDAPPVEAAKEVASGKPLKDLVPGPRWVSSLEASRHQNGRCYLTLDGHRSDDVEPYVFVTEDYGKSWRSIRGNLPFEAGACRVVREDLFDPDLLYLGCEFSIWVSLDRGQHWHRLNSNLPTVAVHEIAQHPVAGEIVAGTHGRAAWILDATLLRQFAPEAFAADVHLFRPAPAVKWQSAPTAGSSGTRRFVGDNPSDGAQIFYSLKSAAEEVELRVTTIDGEVMTKFTGPTEAGLHQVPWDLRQRIRRRGRSGRGPRVAAGKYLLTLTVDDQTYQQVLEVQDDPDAAPASPSAELNEFWEEVLGSSEEDEEGGRDDDSFELDR